MPRITVHLGEPGSGASFDLPDELAIDVLAFAEVSGLTVQEIVELAITSLTPQLLAELRDVGARAQALTASPAPRCPGD